MSPARRAADGEEGAALLIVLAVAAVLAMLMTLLVGLSINGMRQAHSDADWNAALAAAYAGVDEYQSRLAEDTGYYRYGNPASPFSSGTVTAPPTANPAFGVGPGGSWATVAGSGGAAQFRYEVDNSTYATTGRIRIRSTGKVGTATRTVIADLKQQGFIDFLYFTDYEVQDPSIAASTGASCYNASGTLKYSWEGRTAGSTCNEIAFGGSDTNNGPVHSNDTIRACGATFTGAVTTAKPSAPFYLNRDANNAACDAAKFRLTGYPAPSGGIIGMPATNSQLKKETRTDLVNDDVPRPGCLYTGPTQFTFYANGTVNVISPFTRYTRIGNANATSGSTPTECGAIAALQSPAGATITVPDNNVMYVQNVPATAADVNYWAPTDNPRDFTCTASGSAGTRGWTFGTGKNATGYPRKTSDAATTETAPTATTYGCRSGDVFVKGTFNGSATLAAENYVFVVGDLVYDDAQDDMLGLVGNNAVWVYNPVRAVTDRRGNVTYHLLDTGKNRTIDAAILSVAHTFQVQNYDKDTTRGTLTILGAIAQKYRGPVGTGDGVTLSTGYAKNYVYDDRFKYKAPPKFLNPVTTTYGVTSWVETAAVWAADGSAR
ncbi:hypothetical protein [Microbacterium luticocti]|uniref:hypothetical protein n=1 Tax=Microbacterium luticocti TaxID=451764 RepID=UPI00040216C5|nr:hypothetical protein [Microbacterium luticocti]